MSETQLFCVDLNLDVPVLQV